MRVKLTVVDGCVGESEVPNISLEGECSSLPIKGVPFTMKNPIPGLALDRFILTSVVSGVDVLDNIMTFYTENGSIYTLEVLG